MAYKLFLDDERFPATEDWKIARNFHEAVAIMEEFGCPLYISFDHDLGIGHDGEEKTGKHVADWMVEQELNSGHFFPEGFAFYVHSQNSVGAKNIETYLGQFLELNHEYKQT